MLIDHPIGTTICYLASLIATIRCCDQFPRFGCIFYYGYQPVIWRGPKALQECHLFLFAFAIYLEIIEIMRQHGLTRGRQYATACAGSYNACAKYGS